MVILSLTFVVIAIVTGLLISKHRYNTKLKTLSKSTSAENYCCPIKLSLAHIRA